MPKPGTRQSRGYGAGYQRARRRLLEGNPKCHWCGALATTADHEPPIEVVGHPHLNLVPACAPCNYGRRGNGTPPTGVVNPSGRW